MNGLVENVSGNTVNVVGEVGRDFVVNNYAERDASGYVLEFDLDAETEGFVGRRDVLIALDRFAATQPCGYFEIVAEAGLGKTALAAVIAQQRDAIAFLASAGRGTQRASQFLQHVTASLLQRYLPDRKSLPAQVGESTEVLTQTLRDAVALAPGRALWLVVDGLDEAEPAAPGANPLLLPLDLPTGVFVVVTRRSGTLVTGPATPVVGYLLRRDDPQQREDIVAFIRDRMAQDDRLGHALRTSAVEPDELAAELARRCDGSFMYLRYVLADIAERPGELDLRRLPDRLRGYYDQFWAAIGAVRQQDWDLWEQLHKPVLERLAVAAEGVGTRWLADQVGRPADEIEARVLEPWARILSTIDRDGIVRWRLVHRSFADYLEETGKLDRVQANSAVAEVYLRRGDHAYEDWDEYGLRHAVAHLVRAAEQASGKACDDLGRTAARLAAEPALLRLRLALEPGIVDDDLVRIGAVLSRSEADDATSILVEATLALLAFRRELVRPAAIFDAATRGKVTRAEQLLGLLAAGLDDEWRAAMELTVAWLAAKAAPSQARALRDGSLRRSGSGDPSLLLERMHEHLAAVLGEGPAPPSRLGPPPEIPDAEAMVQRLAGSDSGANTELLLASGGYLAGADAPQLVALAVAHPDPGQHLLRAYIVRHAAYGYSRYRAGSLRWVLEAVLADADPERVQPWLSEICTAVLSPSQGEFPEALEIASLTGRARLGDRDAIADLAARAEAAKAAATTLPEGVGTGRPMPSGASRDQSDLWGVHRRRLAALAESAAMRQLHAEAHALLDAAFKVKGGFAGFTAPAYLTLAEAASLVAPRDAVDRAKWFGIYARRAAENIRDPVHCLRMTARVATMSTRWNRTLDQTALGAAIERLASDPTRPEFSALHVVGEPLTMREPGPMAPRPEAAATLRDLAHLYDRSVEDFMRINGGCARSPDEMLDAGSHINVPDPTSPALVAAHLAAAVLESLGAGGTPAAVGGRLVRRLVPAALGAPTAAGTTLARLVLAIPAIDAAAFDAVGTLAARAGASTSSPGTP